VIFLSTSGQVTNVQVFVFVFVDLSRDDTETDDATGSGPKGSPVYYRYTLDAHGIRH
jgi:hypothetical protein